MAVLLKGCIDQKGVLTDWLRAQPAPSPRRVWIATDPDHTARAVLLARKRAAFFLGGVGCRASGRGAGYGGFGT
jgi:hypothetical protein